MPDYVIRLDGAQVVFVNKGTMHAKDEGVMGAAGPLLASLAYDEARSAAPGWDVYVLEHEWRSWMRDGGLVAPKSADKAFVGFCRKWFEKRGRPE